MAGASWLVFLAKSASIGAAAGCLEGVAWSKAPPGPRRPCCHAFEHLSNRLLASFPLDRARQLYAFFFRGDFSPS